MPTYQYKCNDCGCTFETFQRISAKPLSTCEKCSSSKIQRVISASGGFILKGEGYYVTDFKNKPKEKPSTSTKKEEKTVSPAKPSNKVSKQKNETKIKKS